MKTIITEGSAFNSSLHFPLIAKLKTSNVYVVFDSYTSGTCIANNEDHPMSIKVGEYCKHLDHLTNSGSWELVKAVTITFEY